MPVDDKDGFIELCISTIPVPFGAKVIAPAAPSVIVIEPEVVPLLVLKIKSVVPPVVTVSVPAPLERIVAAAAASPTVTVSALRTTSPVPCGAISISALEVETISCPLTSKSPPN